MTFKFGKKIEDEVFKVFVWLAWKILDLEYQLKASFSKWWDLMLDKIYNYTSVIYYYYLFLIFM